MKINKKINFGMFFIIGILLMVSFTSAYMRSDPKYTQISSGQDSGVFDKQICEAGQDFIIQIAPFGCTPAVVRSDLLEEQNVPVFCQLGATKINPLIDVDAIEGISFKGQYPQEVSGVGFHPAKAALGIKGDLNSPVLNNIGYAVIVLKKQKNASAMPEFVQGNLTANIKYDIKNAFGIGAASFYLPEMSDQDWENKHIQYGFWDGRGYLRAEGVDEDGATVVIYDDIKKISSVNLRKGETSEKIYLPGFDCLAGLQLKLNDLEAPDTRVELRVNADVVEVKEGETFLENRCKVTKIDKQGLVQRVSLNCKEDEGSKNFDLIITPKIKLDFFGVKEEGYEIGDKLYELSGGEKFVYLGYIGETFNGVKFIIPVVSPARDSNAFKDTLIFKKLPSIVKAVRYNSGDPLFNLIKGVFSVTGGGLFNIGNFLITGSYPIAEIYEKGSSERAMQRTQQGGTEKMIVDKLMGLKEIEFVGFAGAYDRELQVDAKTYYDNAMKDYETIVDSFSEEKNTEDNRITFGEQALFEEIKLAEFMGQKETMVKLCEKFKGRYPKSTKNLKLYCDNKYKLSNSEISSRYVSINGKIKQISFDGIYEPSFEEYGAEVFISGFDEDSKESLSEQKRLVKNSEVFLLRNDFIQLVDLDKDYATIEFNVKETVVGAVTGVGTRKKIKLNDYATNIGKNKYKITVNKINLKNSARISVIPSINNAGTEANFSFKVGIEKRAIELSPEKTKKKIKELNETIKEWGEKSEQLGDVVKGLKGACLGVGAMMTVKNFFANVGGKAIARQNVMRGEGGWYERCADYVSEGKYYSQEDCMVEEASNIDKDVDAWSKSIEEQNQKMKLLQEGITETSTFGERVVNDDKFMEKYASSVQKYLEDNFYGNFTNPDNPDESINMEEMKTILSYDGWKNNGNYDKEQLRNIELYAKILKSNPKDAMAKKRLYSELSDVKINSENYADKSDSAKKWGISPNQIAFLETGKNAKQLPYSGMIVNGIPVQFLQTSEGKVYRIVLDDSSGTDMLPIKRIEEKLQIYDEGNNLVSAPELENVYFKKYDKASYQNEYKSSLGDDSACLRYYETEPYKGLPAVVPFDLKEGWYAYVGQTLPIFGNIGSYDASGRVTSFWVCNVGKNGREESKGGDDICQMINTGTGQPYNVFYGLSSGDASRLVQKAVQSIEEASKRYKPGLSSVSINGKNIKVCKPMADVPEMQCQDFMSPKDCQLLFNVCDPVICPSSRCDFGGAYAVKDVIQSGIIGSILLCLPNFREGIYVPICLTGIKAGIDGLLSIYTSYRDCLQTSLDTGEMVGVCDEIYSIYSCEFFWRQSLPLANIIIPKMIEIALGQNVHGGGEYLGVASAWENAGKSIDYFTQYYAANSFTAFKARTTEEVGGEVCKSFISGVYPEGGNLLDTLTEPDSPPQFTGRFDEIPFTSTTVPPISQYKVFYHIFAGKDSRAYYQVYLKGGAESSFYQDTSNRRIVASGFIPKGGYASETKDFTAPSGYKELCIMVNNQEECGFKEVSTSFAVNYVKDQYLASQTTETDVKTEKECISGTASVYSLLTPNLQSGAEEMIDPAIYKRGITRICATDDPGKGTDPYTGTENARWKQVGYCGDKKIKCWLDSESVENAIKTTTVEEGALKTVTESYLDILMSEGNYVADFDGLLKEIKDLKTNKEKINKINEFYERVFFNNQKANFLLLRGNAYGELAMSIRPEELGARIESAQQQKQIDYSSIIFEFKDGNLLVNNLYYRYFNEKWQWTADLDSIPIRWLDIPKIEIPEMGLTDRNQEFMKSLENKNFEDGFKILIKRTLENKEGFGSIGNAELATASVSLSQGVFNIQQEGGEYIYFRYESDKWWWNLFSAILSFNKESSIENGWTASPDSIVQGGSRKGDEPTQKNINLIISLDGKNFDEGAFILFTQIGVAEKEICQKEIGEKIIQIASIAKKTENIDDNKIKKDIGAESFECLILQIAMQESNLKHCKASKERDCLYCDGKEKDVLGEQDKGVMQINTKEHSSINASNFEENVLFAISYLITAYDSGSKIYACNGKDYSGWKKALRNYNGWNSDCSKGDNNYVENVLNQKEKIQTLFPEQCGGGIKEEISSDTQPGSCPLVIPFGELSSITDAREKVLKAAEKLNGKKVPEGSENCWEAVSYVYDFAGVSFSCMYSDISGKEYSLNGGRVSVESNKNAIYEVVTSPIDDCTLNQKDSSIAQDEKLDGIKPGDLLSYVWSSTSGHNAIFIEWEDKDKRIAKLFDWNGKDSNGNTVYRYYSATLTDNLHPVYVYWGPEILGKEKTQSNVEKIKWTVASALKEIDAILKGYGNIKYSDNAQIKNFIDQLYEDNILTEKEYVEINGEGLFNLEENIDWIKKLLLSKNASSGQAETLVTD